MRNAAIPLLILGHAVAGVTAAFFSTNRPEVRTAIFFGVIFCQTSLLGMWAGLGVAHWALRLIGLAVGSIYLYYECGWGIEQLDFLVFLLVVLPSVLVAAVTRIVRHWKGCLRRVGVGTAEPPEALQFTIRHLMTLTFLVACLTAIGKVAAPVMHGAGTTTGVAALGVGYAAVALTSIWAVLGSGKLLQRCTLVFLVAFLAGAAGGYLLDSGNELVFWTSTTVLQAVMLVGSLAVCRKVGYRFVAGDRSVCSAETIPGNSPLA